VTSPRDDRLVLLTGPTGYIGGRLLAALQAQDRRVRCLTRRPEALHGLGPRTEVVRADLRVREGLDEALAGVHTAYYLVHSMGSRGAFAAEDRAAARLFAEAAEAAGVRRIIYLGGLGHGRGLSSHLASRQEVGRILASTDIACIEFRAGLVVGSGSLSFEVVRALVHRLPVMVTPRWVRTMTQPIAAEDVIAYLTAALDLPEGRRGVYEIGGPDRLSYEGLMHEYARQRGLQRRVVRVPVLTPAVSSLWLGLVTPVYARVARKMIDGLRNETVVRDDRALRDFPGIVPRPVHEAIAAAIRQRDSAPTRWSDSLSSSGLRSRRPPTPLKRQLVDSRSVAVRVAPHRAFAPVQRIGGRTGWYYGDALWGLRGLLDLVVGGVGTRRGRRHPEALALGDTVDFWRVEAYEPDRLLRLVAEMRLPGKAWLQFRVEPSGDGALIRQTAFFEPSGLFGRLYWYALVPAHQFVFRGMLRRIAEVAEGRAPVPTRGAAAGVAGP
jgi:uncharacterized protein YbjT (DUF2867 family)